MTGSSLSGNKVSAYIGRSEGVCWGVIRSVGNLSPSLPKRFPFCDLLGSLGKALFSKNVIKPL